MLKLYTNLIQLFRKFYFYDLYKYIIYNTTVVNCTLLVLALLLTVGGFVRGENPPNPPILYPRAKKNTNLQVNKGGSFY
jgi:hypothetical protein